MSLRQKLIEAAQNELPDHIATEAHVRPDILAKSDLKDGDEIEYVLGFRMIVVKDEKIVQEWYIRVEPNPAKDEEFDISDEDC